MGKLKIKIAILLACAVVVYIIALVVFHYDYSFVAYGYLEEDVIIFRASVIYLVAVMIVACAIMIYAKPNMLTKEDTTAYEKSKQKVETGTTPLVTESNAAKECKGSCIENVKHSQYSGTGVFFLMKYVTLYLVVGAISTLTGIFGLVAFDREDDKILGIVLIIYGVCCLLSVPFIQALITITKAAKKYLDNN